MDALDGVGSAEVQLEFCLAFLGRKLLLGIGISSSYEWKSFLWLLQLGLLTVDGFGDLCIASTLAQYLTRCDFFQLC